LPQIGAGVAIAPVGQAMATPSCVLIVEDDPNTLSGYLEFLTAAGYHPIGVGSGADALPIAFRQRPDAVVTDITLPGLDGFALAAALHADLRTRHVPVIGLTAHWTSEIHLRARDAAMHVILAKPCIPAHLIAELDRVLGSAGASDEPAVAPPAPREPAQTTSAAQSNSMTRTLMRSLAFMNMAR
jgi:DNA-binding response OmpR family regulator